MSDKPIIESYPIADAEYGTIKVTLEGTPQSCEFYAETKWLDGTIEKSVINKPFMNHINKIMFSIHGEYNNKHIAAIYGQEMR